MIPCQKMNHASVIDIL